MSEAVKHVGEVGLGDGPCGHVDTLTGRVEGLQEIGECTEGCCTDYRCPACGKEFRVEWS